MGELFDLECGGRAKRRPRFGSFSVATLTDPNFIQSALAATLFVAAPAPMLTSDSRHEEPEEDLVPTPCAIALEAAWVHHCRTR